MPDFSADEDPWYDPFPGTKNLDEGKSAMEYGVLVSMLQLYTPRLERAHIRITHHAVFQDLAWSNASLPVLKSLTLSAFSRQLMLDRDAPILKLADNLEVLHLHHSACLIEIVSGAFINPAVSNSTIHPPYNLTEISLSTPTSPSPNSRCCSAPRGSNWPRITINPRDPKIVDPRCGMRRPHEVAFDHALNALLPWRQTLKELTFYHHPEPPRAQIARLPPPTRVLGARGRLSLGRALLRQI